MAEPAELNLDELRRRARRRLVGAVVLALGAAVIVPMLLESEPRPLGEDVTVRIPQVDEGRFVNRLQDKDKAPAMPAGTAPGKATAKNADSAAVEPGEATIAAPKVESAPAPAANAGSGAPPPKRSLADAEQKVLGTTAKPNPAPTPAVATAAPQATSRTAPAKATKAAPEAKSAGAAPDTKTAAPAYSVQLAAFSDDKGANALANKLKRAGHSAYTEPLETSKGTLWRVRVGPFPTREDAVAARDKLKGEGQAGIVTASK